MKAASNTLSENDPRKAHVFGDLSVEEAAEVLPFSAETVMRDWKFARSWLHAELSNR